jgi:exopolyphosphatase/guanosine-5'-triphosphate,3'-diphosphate pyrophosphatase
VNTARAIFAARMGQPVADTAAIMPVEELRVLLADMARLDLGQRRQVDGLPPARADVFPTALAIVIALAEIGDFSAFHHSVHNLRYGVAAELLQAGDRGSPEAV